MKRPVGLILTAIVQILGSLLVLLSAVGTAILPYATRGVPNGPPLPPGLFVGMAIGYAALGILGIATAIGLLRWQRWSRYSTLIFAAFLLFVGLLVAFVFAVMPLPAPPEAQSASLPPNFTLIVKTVMVAVQLFVAAIGAWWLFYFTRKPVREGFEAGRVPAEGPGERPLSIAMLAVLSLLSVPFLLITIWTGLPFMVMGFLLHGNVARMFGLIFLGVNLYIGIGLWRLVPASRVAAMLIYAFACLNASLCYLLPGREARFSAILAGSSRFWNLSGAYAVPDNYMTGWVAGLVGTFVMSAISLYFLITRRYAFERRGMPSPPPGEATLASN